MVAAGGAPSSVGSADLEGGGTAGGINSAGPAIACEAGGAAATAGGSTRIGVGGCAGAGSGNTTSRLAGSGSGVAGWTSKAGSGADSGGNVSITNSGSLASALTTAGVQTGIDRVSTCHAPAGSVKPISATNHSPAPSAGTNADRAAQVRATSRKSPAGSRPAYMRNARPSPAAAAWAGVRSQVACRVCGSRAASQSRPRP